MALGAQQPGNRSAGRRFVIDYKDAGHAARSQDQAGGSAVAGPADVRLIDHGRGAAGAELRTGSPSVPFGLPCDCARNPWDTLDDAASLGRAFALKWRIR